MAFQSLLSLSLKNITDVMPQKEQRACKAAGGRVQSPRGSGQGAALKAQTQRRTLQREVSQEQVPLGRDRLEHQGGAGGWQAADT